MGEKRAIRVCAYSGYKVNERPVRFEVEGRWVHVAKVLERGYGQDCDTFKVLGKDGCAYRIEWRRIRDAWFLIGSYPKTDPVRDP